MKQLIGTGASVLLALPSKVFRGRIAEDTKLKREVALKFYPTTSGEDEYFYKFAESSE